MTVKIINALALDSDAGYDRFYDMLETYYIQELSDEVPSSIDDFDFLNNQIKNQIEGKTTIHIFFLTEKDRYGETLEDFLELYKQPVKRVDDSFVYYIKLAFCNRKTITKAQYDDLLTMCETSVLSGSNYRLKTVLTYNEFYNKYYSEEKGAN